MLKSHSNKLTLFLDDYSSENWVMEVSETEKRGYVRVTYRAIDVSKYAETYLFRMGRKVLLMSATILNADGFAKSLGIPKSDYDSISIPSPFPIENRPIIHADIGSFSAKVIDYTLPRAKDAVKAIMSEHKKEKGIIHCIDGDASVTMANGRTKSLRNVQIGEHVLSYNEEEKIFEAQEVTNFWNRGVKPVLTIELEDGNTITCTPDHKFLTHNRGWVEAQYLTLNDNIVEIK